ncbi:Endonuclease, Uma2 family (restriction endonuclease fold) [Granulicella rosea]|uniref:Endonuclease, Uma2 family (Restriction endonuclease fold) n=1 Tax=Granulicella rosea TaxID=474952 RepID=A0A239HP85_9BACT|nr:Uma2 family endonuclease [Granulicella rosea]SNS83110.1 Endonuclease, Uma2 family (restriction endonuclease fold) [Granulicella rosea]
MNISLSETEFPVRLRFERPLTDEELMRFCSENDILRVERDANGELIVMSPSGLEGSSWNSEIIAELIFWARTDGRGKVFDSNGGFTLPDSSMRSPDAAWVSWSRWNALPPEERKVFGRITPEFIIELRSESDRLSELQSKMRTWLDNGVELAWLIDPQRKVIEVYRPNEQPEIHEDPTSVQGTGPVRGFELVLSRVWGG